MAPSQPCSHFIGQLRSPGGWWGGRDMTSRCTHLKARLHEANLIEQLTQLPR